jgi:hypothetical protein
MGIESAVRLPGDGANQDESAMSLFPIGSLAAMKKYLGTSLMIAGFLTFIVPRLNWDLPEGLSIPTLPTDILGGILLLAGVARKIYEEQ